MPKKYRFQQKFLISLFFAVCFIGSSSLASATDVTSNITTPITWTAAGSPYIIKADITVTPTGSLTIDPGVQVKFDGNFYLDAQGKLLAQGTPENRIIFTSNQTSPLKGNWQYLRLNDNTSIISHSTIEYADRGVYVPSLKAGNIQSNIIQENNTGIYSDLGSSSVIVHNTIINNNDGILVGCNSFSTCGATINNNSIYSNTGYNVRTFSNGTNASGKTINATNNWWGTTDSAEIAASIFDNTDDPLLAHINDNPYLNTPAPGGSGTFVNGIITGNIVWNAAGSPYTVEGNTTIGSSSTLTIQPGVTVQFAGNFSINAQGALLAQGTAENPVIFTSNKMNPAKGDWQRLELHGSSNMIDHAIIEYADWGVYVPSTPLQQSPTIQHSTIRENNTGIYFEPSTKPNILFNTITSNNDGIFAGCNVFTGCTPVINNNSIDNNANYNIRAFSYSTNASGTTINAENNWWGSVDLTQIENTLLHFADDPNLAHIDFVPYLDAPGGNPVFPLSTAPQLNTASGINFGVNLVWSPAQYATGYKVHHGTTSGNYTTTLDVGNVLNFTVTGLTPDILYYFVVSGYNPSGDGPLSNELTAAPTNIVYITDNSVTNRFFDPQKAQTATIQYTLDMDANMTIDIYDGDTQALVRTLVNNQPRSAGANAEIFDGKDDTGQILPQAVYIYKITASTNQGGAGSYDPVFSGGLGPALFDVIITPDSNFSPFKGERLKVSYTLQQPALVSLGFTGQADFLVKTPRDIGSHEDHWNGRDGSGQLIVLEDPEAVKAKTEKLPENFIVIQDDVTLDVTLLTSDPYLIRPLYNESTQVVYSINETADVTVSILTEDGKEILNTLEQANSKSAGTYTLAWDGRTADGETIAEEGDYRVRVQAVDSTGESVVRDGNIRILF